MQSRMSALPFAFALLSVVACDDEPEYSAEPGIDVCEMIVDECARLCDTDPSNPQAEEFSCSFDTSSDFASCGYGVERREGLQEETGPHFGTATWAARGIVVGYFTTCEGVLSPFPVFCYNCL